MQKPFKGDYTPSDNPLHEKKKDLEGGALDYPLVYQPVYAVGAGTIRFTVFDRPDTGANPTLKVNPGNLIVLHTMWNNQPITVVYVHLQQNSLKVGAGDEVKEGQLLATSGNSGDTTGPHLHIQASYGHLELQDYYGAYKGPFIEPVSQIWAGAGDPSGVTGDGHPNGSVGGDNASTGTVDTENQLRQEGDFSKVKRLLTRESILSGVEFNPPPPTPYLEAGWISNRRANSDRNPRGWIVRDPVALGITGAVPATQTAAGNADSGGATATDGTKNNSGGDWLGLTQKYGMRFHYNPEQTGESYSTAMGSDPILMRRSLAIGNAPVGLTGGGFSFTVVLDRRADVSLFRTGNDVSKWYPESITKGKLQELGERGTLVDLEYLIRVFNGDPQQLWHGLSSDFGLILPVTAIVSFGDAPVSRKIRGIVQTISVDHRLFASGMVPTRTYVTISMMRIVDSYYMATGDTDPTGDSKIGGTVAPKSGNDVIKQKTGDEALGAFAPENPGNAFTPATPILPPGTTK